MSGWEEYLQKIYYDPSHPASYEGIKNVYSQIKKEGKYKISHNQLKNWLQKQDAYSLNKSVKRNFQRGRVIVSGIDDQWDADLASFAKDADQNRGYKYLLFVIDIFSRFGWIQPLKDKSATRIVKAFNNILSEGRKPRRLRSDAATDFTSKKFQKNLKKNGIHYFSTHSEKQANYVERFIKTIKARIWRHIRATNSRRYIHILPKLLDSYNKKFHSGIKIEPVNVNKKNESRLWWQMYWPNFSLSKDRSQKKSKRNRKRSLFSFKVGDRVRISHLRSAFQREYDIKWSGEIFRIYKRFLRQGQPIYKIADWFNTQVKGTFYQKELQKVDVTDTDEYKIEKVVAYKGRGKNKLAKVRWLNWPKKFDTWVSTNQLTDYVGR